MKFEISARQDLGGRSSQQDAWKAADKDGANIDAAGKGGAVVPNQAIVILADGVGGQSGGDIASNTACDTFLRTFRKSKGKLPERLKKSLKEANQAVLNAQQQYPEARDMATTLIGAVLDGRNMTFVSVGDSLLLRVRDNELHHVNLDHSFFDVVDRRALESGDPKAWAEAHFDRRRKTITLALGATLNNSEMGHSAQIDTRPMQPGDILILASDGIETLQFTQIQNIVRHAAPRGVAAIADGLILAVRGIAEAQASVERNFAQDNTTIVVVRAEGTAQGGGLFGEGQGLANSLLNMLIIAGGGLFALTLLLVAGWIFFNRPATQQAAPTPSPSVQVSPANPANPGLPSGNKPPETQQPAKGQAQPGGQPPSSPDPLTALPPGSGAGTQPPAAPQDDMNKQKSSPNTLRPTPQGARQGPPNYRLRTYDEQKF